MQPARSPESHPVRLRGTRRLRDPFRDVAPFMSPDAEDLQARLARGGVSVRLGANLELPGTVRVTVASDEGFALLERALRGRDA